MKKFGAASALLVLALAGCSTLEESENATMSTISSPSKEPVTETQIVETTTEEPVEEPDEEKGPVAPDGVPAISPHFSAGSQTLPSSGDATFEVADFRAGDHGAFDRFVFQFSGDGAPAVETHYVDTSKPHVDDMPIVVGGEAFFKVTLKGTTQLLGTDVPYLDSNTITAGNIVDIKRAGGPDGEDHWFIGLDTQRPYAIGMLENPTRLVIDFKK